jgi:hypothetical protein
MVAATTKRLRGIPVLDYWVWIWSMVSLWRNFVRLNYDNREKRVVLTRIYKFAIVTASAFLGATTINVSSTLAYNFSFNLDLDGSGLLSGEFAGTDTNGNGQLDGNEFTAFSSLFQGSESGFENVAWGLTNLAPFSFFVTPNFYSFWVTDPATDLTGTGWRSDSTLGETVVGFAFTPDSIAGRYFSQDTLAFGAPAEAIPEPTTIAGMAVAGLSLTIARGRQKKGQKSFKNKS